MTVNLSSPRTKLFLKVFPVIIACFLLLFIRWTENTFFPVVKDFHLTNLERRDSYLVLEGYMRKVRSCQYVGVYARGVTAEGSVDLHLKFLDPKSDNDTITVPEGSHNWGPWRIVIPASPEITALNLSSIHSCHLAWETTTKLASIPLAAKKDSK